MHLKNKYLAIILNRNLGKECDVLRNTLLSKGVSDVIIVDSSTTPSLQSEFITIRPTDDSTIEHGYRINRGFNLGLNYAIDNYTFDWIFCLPVDTQIIEMNLSAFDLDSKQFPKIVAYTLPESNNPYLPLIKNDIGLVWNILEGPILLSYELVSKYKVENSVSLFDNENFRGFLSFKELALRIYSANLAVGIYNKFLVSEREELLLTYSELMRTESFSLNKQLLISEGGKWLFKKYGIFDRWAFETIIRLLHDEFLLCNPDYSEIKL
jgi:glycosyltransferase involved in cell wall biosynthesis